MAEISAWDVAILFVAAYLSVVCLVRLMRQRRDQLIASLQNDVAIEKRRQRVRGRREGRKPEGTA